MSESILGHIRRIQKMSVPELRAEWLRLHDGAEPRSRNRDHLVKRLCWRVQELAHGGLTDHAQARLKELAPEALDVATLPNVPAHVAKRARPAVRVRDLRKPIPGTILTRNYHDHEIRVLALEDGQFEWDGRIYGSLSAVARAVTGARWNGNLFFGLRERKRKR